MVLGALIAGGLVARRFYHIEAHFPDDLLFLCIYAGVVAFGVWALSYAYEQTKVTLVSTELHVRLEHCVNEIYAAPRITVTGVAFAVFVVLVQFALRFRVPQEITIYLLVWNFIAGLVAGLGIWTAVGSIRLAGACGRSGLDLYDLYPADTPALRKVARLMWTHSFLFASEVLIFSLAITWASVTLRDHATPIYGRFSALDIAGVTVFGFIFVVVPSYTFILQRRVYAAAKAHRDLVLQRIHESLRKAWVTDSFPAPETVRPILQVAQAVRNARPFPVDVPSILKLASLLAPGIAYLFTQHSASIYRLAAMLRRAFLPGYE